ncbi:hypothetical protein M7784_17010 [Desulfovibrio aminophilus]|nr:hypothetical protein [Desulfovibrio aminophilus]MCM0756938.1 hypothetical protein [Desulfovibrio aminophilus]
MPHDGMQGSGGMTRRRFLGFLAACAAVAAAPRSVAGNGAATLRLSGPPVAETLPLLRLVRTGALEAQGLTAAFTPWNSPDQLRALAAGGQIDAAVLSLAAAAVLSNRGLPVTLLALTAPPLWIVSSDPDLESLEQLEGQTVCLPFGPGEMPELLLRALSARTGVSYSLQHSGGGLETVLRLLLGKVRHVFLSEPAASLAVARSRESGGVLLEKRIDIRNAWAAAFPECPLLAHGVLAMLGPMSRAQEAREVLGAAYAAECGWVAAHPREAAALAGECYPALAAQTVEGLVPGTDIRLVMGEAGRDASRAFLRILLEQSPEAVGGRLPGPAFWGAAG